MNLVTATICLTAVVVLSNHFVPYILDVVSPLNESRPLEIHQFHEEIFLDEQKYYHLIMSIIDIISILGAIVVLGTESTMMLFSYHISGQFRVTRSARKFRIFLLLTLSLLSTRRNFSRSSHCVQATSTDK